jgi:hypothetical protein
MSRCRAVVAVIVEFRVKVVVSWVPIAPPPCRLGTLGDASEPNALGAHGSIDAIWKL